eukprot:3572318-Pyramimonas_sp.AAC.1
MVALSLCSAEASRLPSEKRRFNRHNSSRSFSGIPIALHREHGQSSSARSRKTKRAPIHVLMYGCKLPKVCLKLATQDQTSFM